MKVLIAALLFALMPAVSTAQTYTDLHHFNCGTEGCNPRFPAQLAQGRDGNLYGMMPQGGMFDLGTWDCPDFCVIGPYFPREGRHGDQERTGG
ncbi:MAG TPA: hypothetical protein VHJ58_18465 [Vicinamibacterales bacterium]|jgi:hypothetical protein|nr:hypothetical protein [Vicinamibacterales bacterium]